MLGSLSFVLPILIWCVISYVPFVWHPQVLITDPGSVDYLQPGMRMDRARFRRGGEGGAQDDNKAPPRGVSVQSDLPSGAARSGDGALYSSFTTPPATQDGHWLHQSLWHSIQIIFWGFVISSIIGVPLGILCGTYACFARLNEPFIEFFRYLPAPAFGALAVAILGIYDGPKITIIVIGTFFQQVLIIANTTRKLDVALVEAALTLGTKKLQVAVARRHPRHPARSLSRPAHPARLGLDLPDRRRADRHHRPASPGSSPSRRATSISPTSTPRSSSSASSGWAPT